MSPTAPAFRSLSIRRWRLPYLCRPIEWGADIVVHSATKFLGGHGNSLGGVVVDSGRFDWGNGNFPRMTDPVASYGGLSWWGNFGEYAFCTRLRAEQLRDVGPALSPFNAFLLLQGVETLPQRMDAHLANARAVADALYRHRGVSWVRWAGLADHPHHERAARYLPLGAGAVFSFGVVGGRSGRAGVHRGAGTVQPPRQHRRHAHPRHPPGQHHPSPTLRRGARSGGCAAGPDPHLGRNRRCRRHHLGPRPGPERRHSSAAMSTWHNPTATERLQIIRDTSSVAIVGMSADPSRASYFVATYLLSSSCSFDDVWFVNPNGGEILGRPVYRSLTDLPGVPDLVDVFRRSDDLPTVAREFVAIPGTTNVLGAAGSDLRGVRGDRHRGRPDRRDGPLPEDRTCPVLRRPAHGRIRYRCHLVPPPAAALIRLIRSGGSQSISGRTSSA